MYLIWLSKKYENDYMSGFEKFKAELRIQEKFYSLLTSKKICDEEYENVLKVWNTFQIKMMKDYRYFYLKCGVLLLADVLQKFRNNSLKLFECNSFKLGCNT